ncbi:SAP domain-containing protein [Humibacter sp. RRB41]|uniref:SAP domain-containing protein n=1 Tax=Humibacter sp. RRB41 TaxID=2919946 RepID=UPI001FAAA6FB|nr:SAP domain-containing protein [Humibacter sp. RRB41]
MAKIARTHVHVEKKNGQVVIFGAGEEIPAWATKLITNPDVYAPDDGEPAAEESEPGAYDGKSDDELRAVLTERELPVDGDTAALVERLTQDDAENQE